MKKYPSSSQTVSINHARILMKNSQFIHSDARPDIHDRNTATVTVWIVFLYDRKHSRTPAVKKARQLCWWKKIVIIFNPVVMRWNRPIVLFVFRRSRPSSRMTDAHRSIQYDPFLLHWNRQSYCRGSNLQFYSGTRTVRSSTIRLLSTETDQSYCRGSNLQVLDW